MNGSGAWIAPFDCECILFGKVKQVKADRKVPEKRRFSMRPPSRLMDSHSHRGPQTQITTSIPTATPAGFPGPPEFPF